MNKLQFAYRFPKNNPKLNMCTVIMSNREFSCAGLTEHTTPRTKIFIMVSSQYPHNLMEHVCMSNLNRQMFNFMNSEYFVTHMFAHE